MMKTINKLWLGAAVLLAVSFWHPVQSVAQNFPNHTMFVLITA